MVLSRGEKTFQVFNYMALTLLALLTLYPFWEVLKVSFSVPEEVGRMGIYLWPSEISLSSYVKVFSNSYIWIGYKNTLVRIMIGVPIQLSLMILTAYPLSKKYLPNRGIFMGLIAFTMFFNGGLIPNYLLVQSLHLYNTIWALILPKAIITFSMLIMRNYFMSIPESLEESAKIDGSSNLRTLISIILPVSIPIIMTVLLWELVSNWNAWFDCLIYMNDPEKYVLQVVLRKIVLDSSPQFSEMTITQENVVIPTPETIKCATIIVSSVPILLVYPFIQKYFVKGIMIGSLKG